ncbi:MAG: hypothetical protein GTN62_12165 [Gemmatimonadales bacterium]|nr:hypothetical protein [Gemmatimonadales bacterium]NIN12474.1 hypothetical protein [Gemmatimonadales bacterium]NIN50850.1 hypothetical protein [Gemmatimonadales bacterium]NIP08314.1 hypothetical protein [Gemmatimonadales bacterium]NIR00838.1 hypothetical protein [Gemmatimonadales bacterium]
MRRNCLILFLASPLAATTAPAQAPPSADLWRVATASLTSPPALVTGAAATFWNPAGPLDQAHLSVGGQMVQTADILGLAGFLIGAQRTIGRSAQVNLLVGRVHIRDLVRTTSSPNSLEGSIPVYEFSVGVGGGFHSSTIEFGGLLRLHESRFDFLGEGGVTFDLGLRVRPFDRLRVAAATHFFPVDFSRDETTDYYIGAEYDVGRRVSIAGTHARVVLRYGTTFHALGGVDHTVGAGMMWQEQFAVDAVLMGESALGKRMWRPALGLSLRFGRYTVVLARSNGLNDLGATYRIGLDVEVMR